jgi:hypothetical protein
LLNRAATVALERGETGYESQVVLTLAAATSTSTGADYWQQCGRLPKCRRQVLTAARLPETRRGELPPYGI